jgi:hypothetical protein
MANAAAHDSELRDRQKDSAPCGRVGFLQLTTCHRAGCSVLKPVSSRPARPRLSPANPWNRYSGLRLVGVKPIDRRKRSYDMRPNNEHRGGRPSWAQPRLPRRLWRPSQTLILLPGPSFQRRAMTGRIFNTMTKPERLASAISKARTLAPVRRSSSPRTTRCC